MAQQINPKELVSFKELLIANSIQVDAILKLEKPLRRQWFSEYFNKLKKVQHDYQAKQAQ